MIGLYPNCKNSSAWDSENQALYQECTNQIIRSNRLIQKSINSIELFSAYPNQEMTFQTELEQILEEIEVDPGTTNGLKIALAYIENKTMATSNQSMPCIEIEGCLERTREVLIGLQLIEWGIHGLGAASVGQFLAYHHHMLGSYFGDQDGNEWPHIPLRRGPTSLEEDFNQLLTRVTVKMSKELTKNVSLLDLPGFGSTVTTLKRGLKKQFLWPIKTSFALLQKNQNGDKRSTSASFKTLTEDWAHYMDHLKKENYAQFYTMAMRKNKHLNFTNHIQADKKTFLIAMAGNEIHLQQVYLCLDEIISRCRSWVGRIACRF